MVKPDHSKTKPFQHGLEEGGEAAVWTSVNSEGELESEYKNLHEESEQREEDKELVAAARIADTVLSPVPAKTACIWKDNPEGPNGWQLKMYRHH